MPALSVSAQTRLMVVAPHPDDETLGCGLLIQQVLAAGGVVRLLLLTDGDNNPWPQRFIERRLHMDAVARRCWGQRRRQEVMQAMEQLGLPASALQPLGWSDLGLTCRLRDNASGAIAALQAAMHAFEPSIMACPALTDAHPDHSAAHVLSRLALAHADPAPLLLAYLVHGHGKTDASAYPILIDTRVEQQQRKLQAMAEHQTQMVLSGKRMRRMALSPERYKQVDLSAGTGCLRWRPPAALRPWLRLLIVTPAGAQDWRWSEAPLVRDPDGGFRLSWLPGSSVSGPAFAKLHLDWPSPWIFDHWGWQAL
ncbi:PIG-L family deacetylase [Dyella sp. M7H15-1]|uniref:PIG-L deacetylase family protein n=1 Tax=Dyella sp. M7H15-1 TaxID=2501295 RepID=UPI0010052703|nr:PIG-L family deacetylase [Dyella sp. M7H15-1]QAU23882.1 PIG-L family deacetylase [Dyella sp. M7H15-1]